jgi:hypothetical protein
MFFTRAALSAKPHMIVNTRSHPINVVATPMFATANPSGGGWGVCIVGAARSGQRSRLRVVTARQAAPWLQRVRIYETASRLRALVRHGSSGFPV